MPLFDLDTIDRDIEKTVSAARQQIPPSPTALQVFTLALLGCIARTLIIIAKQMQAR